MKRLFSRMLDETEFLSDFGVRAISKFHEQHPYKFRLNGTELAVSYVPGESDSGVFGGNSNWRCPIWFPVNYLLGELPVDRIDAEISPLLSRSITPP
jgi:hypothetical protein